MSQAALCQAVRDQLQTVLSLTSESCEVMPNGRPKPDCGEQFIAVHPGPWSGQFGDYDLDETFGVLVTVTRRLSYAPADRWGMEIWAKAGTGLDAVCRQVMIALAGPNRYAVLVAANSTYLGLSSPAYPGGFVEPLKFESGGSPPVLQGPDWFSAEQPDGIGVLNVGLSQTLTFTGARRVQTLDPADS